MCERSDGRQRVALGLRAHSGWAALVVVGGPPRSPAVLDRRRIELADPSVAGSKQPYHAAEGLSLTKAEAIVGGCVADASRRARSALRSVIEGLREEGHDVVGCGLLLAAGRPLPDLASVLASHALIHAAEGDLFRDVLKSASERCDVPVTGVRERDLYARGAARLRVSAEELQRRIGEMGRALGPPWRQDEKLAALVGWLVLAAPAT